MKARCPFCLNENPADCDYCDDGEITLNVAEGAMYTLKCENPECGFENGIRIVDGGESLPPLSEDLGAPRECALCGADASYEFFGMSGPGGFLNDEDDQWKE